MIRNLLIFLFCVSAFSQGATNGVIASVSQRNNINPDLPRVITLGEKKGLPSFVGYGKYTQGGNGGTKYFVTNTLNSGSGSLRAALEATGCREIYIMVTGNVSLSSPIFIDEDNACFSLFGQFAPGEGLTVSNNRIVCESNSAGDEGVDNFIMMHITLGVDNSSLGEVDNLTVKDGDGEIYITNVSSRFAQDEQISIQSINNSGGVSIVYNIMAQSDPDHNTASLTGGHPINGSLENTGNFTYAYNFFYLISHRFPNIASLNGYFQVYNNSIAGWATRMSRINGSPQLDWINNEFESNGLSDGGFPSVNKFQYYNESSSGNFRVFTQRNFVDYYEESPDDNDFDMWQYFNGSVGESADTQIDSRFRSLSRLSDEPFGWHGLIVPTANNTIFNQLKDFYGHSRGVGADGLVKKVRDGYDNYIINNRINGTMPSSYPATSTWGHPLLTSNAAYVDSDGDLVSDNFEDIIGTDKNFNDANFKPNYFYYKGWAFDNRERTGGYYGEDGNYYGGTLTGENLYDYLKFYTDYLGGGIDLIIETRN